MLAILRDWKDFIHGFHHMTARSSAFNLTLVERRRFHTAIQVYKILKRLSPSYLLSTFRSALSVTGHAGRNVHRLYVPAV